MAKSEPEESAGRRDFLANSGLPPGGVSLSPATVTRLLNAGNNCEHSSNDSSSEAPREQMTSADTGAKYAQSIPLDSSDAFRLLVEAVQDYAIFLLDTQGCVSTWNMGARRIKGYNASEIIGEHFSKFYPPEDIAANKPGRELEIAIRDGRLEDEGWRLRKDGSKFWANVIITALRDSSGKLVGFAKVTRDITERMRAHEALQEANRILEQEVQERKNAQLLLLDSERSLRLLSRHLLRSQDEERKRIGRELHDSVGQYLAVLKMNLDSIRSSGMADRQAVAQQVGRCSDLAEQCIKEVRTISYLLYPPMLEEMGLRSAMLWYLDGFGQRSGIETRVDIPTDMPRLPRDVELVVFRVLQESLTNVHRHSGSPVVYVRADVKDDYVVLEVRDQGKGIPAESMNQSGYDARTALGVGLRGMTERSKQLGGKLEVSSGPQGTTIRAIIPCMQEDEVATPAISASAAAAGPSETEQSQGAR
jgi:PAS domain S-box-containing protein